MEVKTHVAANKLLFKGSFKPTFSQSKGLFTLSVSDNEIENFLRCFAAHTLIFSDGSLNFMAFAIAIA